MNPQNDTFENKLRRLEQIVRTMEKGDVPLDESMKLFREGTELVRSCSKRLDEAELQVKMVLSDESGNPVEEDFLDGNDG